MFGGIAVSHVACHDEIPGREASRVPKDSQPLAGARDHIQHVI